MESKTAGNARRITGERMTNVVTLSREELHAVSVKFWATAETVLNDLPRISDYSASGVNTKSRRHARHVTP